MRLCKLSFLALASILCTAFPATARAAPQAPIAEGRRGAIPPGTLGQTPPANNTPLIQPASLSGAEDKSYLSAATIEATNSFYRAYLRIAESTESSTEFQKLPKSLYGFNIRTKVDGSGTYLAPEFSYMDVFRGIEGSIQGLMEIRLGRTVTGPGFSLRFDLSPSRSEWIDSYKQYISDLPATLTSSNLDMKQRKQKILEGPQPLSLEARVQTEQKLRAAEEAVNLAFRHELGPDFGKFLDDFFGSARKIRISAFATNQWLDSAQLSTVGISVSQVVPTRHYPHAMKQVWGLVPRVAVQELVQDLSASEASQAGVPHASNAVRTSLGLALQNNIPHLIYDTKNCDGSYPVMPGIARWNFQVGAEYVFRNVVDQRESYGVYARFRNLKTFSELSFSVSKTTYQDVQFGVGFGITTDWKKHPSQDIANPTP